MRGARVRPILAAAVVMALVAVGDVTRRMQGQTMRRSLTALYLVMTRSDVQSVNVVA